MGKIRLGKKKLAIPAILLALALVWGIGCSSIRLAQPNPPPEPARSLSLSDRGSGEPKASQGTTPGEGSEATAPERMVIYTAHLSLEVDNLTQSLDAIGRLAREAGGYLASVNREGRSSTIATVTLRVPATAYEETLARLRQLATKVMQENSSTKDVGEEYSDLGAQLRNLEAAEAQYRELLRRAPTIDEILRVQQRLDEVRGRIERTQGRMKYLERQSEMATITLALSQVAPPAPVWEPAQAAQEAWEASLALWRTGASYGLWALVFGWWLPLPLVVAMFLWRRHRRSAASPGQA